MARQCPECGSEWVDTVLVCGDCGCDLLTGAAPETESSSLVSLWRTKKAELLAELVDRLERAEVPYVVVAGTAIRAFEGNEDGAEELPAPWEAQVLVSSDLEERAARILVEVKRLEA